MLYIVARDDRNEFNNEKEEIRHPESFTEKTAGLKKKKKKIYVCILRVFVSTRYVSVVINTDKNFTIIVDMMMSRNGKQFFAFVFFQILVYIESQF